MNPIYKDLTKQYALESSQRFFRESLSGKLKFVRDDYTWLDEQDFETAFILLVEESTDYGQTWKEFAKGRFYKTDCTWNVDDQYCEVQPDVYDAYNDVIAGLDKEYNLIKLAPEITRLTIKKRPLIQIYQPGQSVVSCFLGGTYWEQDAEEVDDVDDLTSMYHFAHIKTLLQVSISDYGYGGVYVGQQVADEEFSSDNAVYRLFYFEEINDVSTADTERWEYRNGFHLTASWDTSKIYYTYSQSRETTKKDGKFKDIPTGQIKFKWTDGDNEILADVSEIAIYGRYLLDTETILGLNTYLLPTSDIVEDNRNYKRCIGYNFDVISVSQKGTTEVNEWGVRPDGLYYAQPEGTSKYFPVARSSWDYMSVWFNFDENYDKTTETAGRSDFELRDAFPLSSVISVLLEQFSDVKHEATTEYSQFLYGSYNPVSYQAFTLLISPKSNVLHGNYDQPAQKAETTLNTILKMLRDVFRCYWYIEDGKLKIEHISWFRNGGSYREKVVGSDLTTLKNVRNGKPWGYKTSSYEFDKENMPERYEFSWMDEVTEGFDGYPIEIDSVYVTEGQIEDISISQFTTDIDYMMLNPSAISEDGFALFAAVLKNSQYELPIVERKIDGATLRLQNGYLSWVMLQPNFYISDLPAKQVVINNASRTLFQTSRQRKQTIKYPTLEELDTRKLVKTSLGEGEIEKITVNLSTRLNEITLKYDTEQ
jgi:hypothetical protein